MRMLEVKLRGLIEVLSRRPPSTKSWTLAKVATLLLITNSVFRLAARRTSLAVGAPRLESAPVREKRVGLSRSPVPPGLWALNAAASLPVRHREHSGRRIGRLQAVPAGPLERSSQAGF